MAFRARPTRTLPVGARQVLGVALFVLCAAALSGCGTTKADSVLLVTIDTLRADHVSCYGATKVRTPYIDRVAADGARADRAWATVPLTTPSHASILTGLYPPGHGVRSNTRFRVPDSANTLAEVFAKNGRKTAAFVSAFTTSTFFGLQQGFQTYDDDFGHDPRGSRYTQRLGGETVARALAWLDGNGSEPFFLWVHLFDPHTPYAAPGAFGQQYASDPYSGEVAYADAQLGRLLEKLDQLGRRERTVIVVLSDHGEGLRDHGEPEHGILLYEETLHVPLVIAAPGKIRPGTVWPGPNSTTDIFPTLMEIFDLPASKDVQGRSLLAPPDPARQVYAETLYPHEEFGWSALYALRERDDKYIESPVPELFDLATDPKELKNLARNEAATAQNLARALRTKSEALLRPEALAEAAGLGEQNADDAETIARLESLGYVAGGTGTGADSGAHAMGGVGGNNPVDMMEDYRIFERAEELVKVGQLAPAVDLLQALARRDPRNPQVLLKLASALDHVGRTADAEATYRQLLDAYPTYYLGYRVFSSFLEKHGRARESRELWLKLMNLLPGYVGLEVRLAQAAIAAGLPAEADKRLAAYLESRADDAEGWSMLGKARVALDRQDDALAAFRKALVLDPRLPAAVEGLVAVLTGQGRKDEARAELDELLRKNPGDPILERARKSL